jgi:phage tail-like protein
MKDKLFYDLYAVTFADSSRHDPYKEFMYEVVITGAQHFAKFGFQRVSGLRVSLDVVEYREGGDNLTTHKSAGQAKFEPITLERGMSEDLDQWNWFKKVFNLTNLSGQSLEPHYKGIMTIKLKDRNKSVVKTWEVVECWPSSWETGDFNAQGSGVMIERVVIQHEGFDEQ